MTILWAIVIGFIAGVIAKFLMPGKDPGGLIVTTLLGMGGAVLSTYLGQAVGLYQGGQTAGLIGAVVGAFIILGIYRMFKGRKG